MPNEIEHKFLVNHEKWKEVQPISSTKMIQAFIPTKTLTVVRARIAGNTAWLTIKGANKGAFRTEFEYEIPVADAEKMISEMCEDQIEKIRHIVHFAGKTWEVDQFFGANEGLWVAEIELQDENEFYELPPWVKEEVTHDMRYTNVELAKNPYQNW